ncbi:MAG: PAS domain-containing protein [Planctomycetes bacterium]|nr:PAS domain-containing protein [Planctomycetota bacterium]
MLSSRFLTKIFAAFAATIVLTAVVVGWLEADSIEKSVRDRTIARLREQAVLLAEVAAPYLGRTEYDEAFQARIQELGRANRTRFTVIREDGSVIADSEHSPLRMQNHRERPEVSAVLEGSNDHVVERASDTLKSSLIYVAWPVVDASGRRVGVARTARERANVSSETGALRTNMLTGIVIAAVLACGAAYFIARKLTDPLRAMTRAVTEMAAGDFSRRVRKDSDDELGDLAVACNSLAEQLSQRIDALGKERQQVVATLRSMVEGVVATDERQRVLFINDSARRMLSVDVALGVGRPLWEITRVQRIGAILDSTLQKEREIADEISIVDVSGGDRILELRSSPMRSEDETVRGAVLVFHDITELRRLEKVRRDFVSNVSHELKTPLTAMRGFVETLLDDPDVDLEIRTRFLERIRNQTERMQSLVLDQLTLAKLEANEAPLDRQRVDLRPLVESSLATIEPIASTKSLRIGFEPSLLAAEVEGDRELLRQVVTNLIDNAVKYTPDEGRVVVRLMVDDANVTFSVEDSGLGLSAEDRRRVFERFYRVDSARSRDVGGTGLGLSIVRNVAVAHGGDVSVESELGKGSTFRVRLPRAV